MSIEKQDMHRKRIVFELHMRDLTVKELSLKAGLGASTLSNVFSRKWPKAEKIVAEALDMKPQEIWPSRY